MKKVLFVCIENSNRSQVAEAFAKIYGKEKVRAFSAGSKPSGRIHPKAIDSMKEIGYDLTTHTSKSVEEFRNESFHAVITMGCGDECPFIPAEFREDWNIPDPKDMVPVEYRKVMDLIYVKVKELLNGLNTTR